MQSSLKKSLYLGLAALTFASVAGASVSATSTNANAAKHAAKKVAKKVTYKTTDSKLDQSVIYVSTGKNAVYSKPGTVKGAKVVASKATMESLANAKSVSAQFMAYQEATTSKGAKYLKVVSFDKKIRGYVYVGGVAKTNGIVNTASQYSFKNSDNTDLNVYLKNPRIFTEPYGKFGAKLINVDKSVYSDAFKIDDAVVNAQGQTYFHIVDLTNTTALTGANAGWINADNLQSTPNNLFADANKLNVNYVDANGNVIKSSKVDAGGYDTKVKTTDADNDAYLSTTASSKIAASSVADLKGTGYKYVNDASDSSYYVNLNALYNAKKGSVVNVRVVADTTATTNNPVKIKFFTADDVNGTNATQVGASDVATITNNKTINATTVGLVGNENSLFNLTSVENNLFGSNGKFSSFKLGNTTYAYSAQLTNNAAKNPDFFNLYNAATTGLTYNDVAGKTLNVYFVKSSTAVVPSASSVVTTDPAASNFVVSGN